MSLHLIETLETALGNLAQEVSQDIPEAASVLVQFAAGDWAKIKAALVSARAAHDALAVDAAPAAEQPQERRTAAPVVDDPEPAVVAEQLGAAPAEELPPITDHE